MAESNKEAIALFHEIQETLPKKDNGEIDITKLRELLQNNNSPAIKYICSKIPEFFLRGCGIFSPYYTLFSEENLEDNRPFDQQFIEKVKNGDFSDIDKFEALYPYIQEFANYLNKNGFNLNNSINNMLFREDKLDLIKLGDDYERCKKAYQDIIKNDGLLDYNGVYLEESGIERELENHPEDKRFLEFALKTIKYYRMSQSDKIFRPFSEDDLVREKQYQETRKQELAELNEKLNQINQKIAKYNFFTSLVKKSDKEADLKQKEKLEKQIKEKERSIKNCGDWITDREEEKEYSEKYKTAYFEIIREKLIPFLKEKIGKDLNQEQKAKVDKLIDNIAERFFSKPVERSTERNPLSLISNQLSQFESSSFDDYIAKFYNSLVTIAGMPNAYLNFEEQENKDLYSLLNIIRGEMKKAPTDEDHGELKDDYRNYNLHNSLSNFMDNTVDHKDIESCMKALNEDFKELMQEENTEEYIKKVGVLWYKFMLTHPYRDGNGRIGRYIINILLAHKNIITTSLYYSLKDQYNFHDSLDEYVIKHMRESDYDKVGELFLQRIKEIGLDLTTRKPLTPQEQQILNQNPQEVSETHHM